MTIVLNRDSWHYRLTDGHLDYARGADLCSYVRLVLRGLLLRLLAGAAVCAALIGALHFALSLWFWVDPELPGFLFAVAVLIALIFFSCALATAIVVDGVESIGDSIVGEAYRGWKDRYCPIVEIID